MSHHRLEAEIEIGATPERVWSILTDFPAYPEWNPFIRFVRGVPEPGARLVVRIEPSGASGMTFHPIVLAATRNQELRWLGRFILPGLFDGDHCFTLRPIAAGRILFRQSELFSGLMVSSFRSRLDGETKRGFKEMNRALKERAEAR